MKKIFGVFIFLYILILNVSFGYSLWVNDFYIEGINADQEITVTAPTKMGYAFSRWEVSLGDVILNNSTNNPMTFSMPSSDAGIYATYTEEIIPYTVSYNKNTEDEVSNLPANQLKTHGVELTLSSTIPTRSGYRFNGWNTASNGSGTSYAAGGSYTANANVTLYAQWVQQVTLEVWVNTNGSISTAGGSVTGAGTYDIGSTVTLTATPNSGYGFSNWNTQGDGSGENVWINTLQIQLTGNRNVSVAFWQQYTVEYNANEGIGRPADQIKLHGSDLILSSMIPALEGYKFVGWNTAQDGSGTTYVEGGSYTANANVTLYAQWSELPAVGSYIKYNKPNETTYYNNGGGDYGWVVLRNTPGAIEIISKESVEEFSLNGGNNFANCVSILNRKAEQYINSTYAVSARCLGATSDMEDLDTNNYPLTGAASGNLEDYRVFSDADARIIRGNSALQHNYGSVWYASRFAVERYQNSIYHAIVFAGKILKSNGNFTSMSEIDDDAILAIYHYNTWGYNDSPSSEIGFRPVVKLKSNVYITGGSGTYEDPYTIGI